MKLKPSTVAPIGVLTALGLLSSSEDAPKPVDRAEETSALPTVVGVAAAGASDTEYGEQESPEMTSPYQLALQSVNLGRIMEILETKFSKEFAGVSFGPPADGNTPRLQIALANPTSARKQDVRSHVQEHAGRARVELVEARYTRDELLAYQDALTAVVDEIRQDYDGDDLYVSLSPDYANNQIAVEASAEVAEALHMRRTSGDVGGVPADAWSIGQSDAVAIPSDSRHTFPPYKAGREIKDVQAAAFGGSSSRSWYCTSAFVVTIQSGNLANQNMGTTAGHCTVDGTKFNSGWNGSNYSKGVGTSYYNVFSPNSSVNVTVDAVMMSLNQADVTNDLYVNSTLTRDVTSVASASSLVVGAANVCLSGATSGVQCGGISHSFPRTLYYQYTHPQTGVKMTKGVTRLACSYARAVGGDSGAPVYRTTSNSSPYTAEAVGIVSASVVTSSGSFLHHCFSPQSEVERYTGTKTLLK